MALNSQLAEFMLLLLTDAFLSSLGLQLVGPYDVLAGKTKKYVSRAGSGRPNYLRHWRYYFDPPEFLTVIRGDDRKQFHLGYYRYLDTYHLLLIASSVYVKICVQ